MLEANKAELLGSLNAGLLKLELALTEETKQKYLDYVALLDEWNQKINLTAVKTQDEMIWRHVIDSLTAYRFVQDAKTILDVGTGAGLPGIILALAMPNVQFTLLDSNQKKMKFCEAAVTMLGLKNVSLAPVNTKLFTPAEKFDIVISRAFSAMDTMLALTKHLCKPNGVFLAMKGRVEEEELAKISKEFKVETIQSVSISDEMAHRHMVVIRQARSF